MDININAIKTGDMYKIAVDEYKTGENISWVMKSMGITPKQLAELIGLSSPNVIYEWMKGSKLPSLPNFFLLAQLTGVKIDDLVAYRRIDKNEEGNIPYVRVCDEAYLNKEQNMLCEIDCSRKSNIQMVIRKFLVDENDFEDIAFWEPEYERMSDLEVGRYILEERLNFWHYAWEADAKNKSTEHERKQFAQLSREVENLRLGLIPIKVICKRE